MELIDYLPIYTMPALLVITTAAIAIIFKNNKSLGNILLLSGFLIHTLILLLPLLFNISPMELNEHNEAVRKTEGFFTFNQIIVTEIVAYSLITLGFVNNAYTTITKT